MKKQFLLLFTITGSCLTLDNKNNFAIINLCDLGEEHLLACAYILSYFSLSSCFESKKIFSKQNKKIVFAWTLKNWPSRPPLSLRYFFIIFDTFSEKTIYNFSKFYYAIFVLNVTAHQSVTHQTQMLFSNLNINNNYLCAESFNSTIV